MEASPNIRIPTKDSSIQKESGTSVETDVNTSKEPTATSDKMSSNAAHTNDIKGEDSKNDVKKNSDIVTEAPMKKNQEEKNEQNHKMDTDEDDKHEEDFKIQKPVFDDSMVEETQSLEKRISSLMASKEHKSNGEERNSDEKEGKRKRRNPSTQSRESLSGEDGGESKRKRTRIGSDKFCWRCHKEAVDAHCSACPRSWHRKCMGGTPQKSPQNWICGECATILRAENAETRSAAMAQLSVDQLCILLKHVVGRMRDNPGSEPFWKPVDLAEVPNYLDFVVKPMDLGLLESNVRAKLYGSTEAFMADAKWIQHNCIVFNTCGGVYADTSKLTNAARQVIKMARQEVSEIEACPDCYSHGRNLPRPQPSWFIEPCRRPHPLVWAKLKGFPFWPAKAMPRLNGQGHVDVRFFGAHDRAWVPPRDLYLYSEDPPAPPRRKRKLDLEECVREISRHCRKLEQAFGQFRFAPPKIQYNPQDPMQIKLMLPNYDPLHPNNVLTAESPSPRRKPTLRKRVAPLRKKSQASDSPTNAASDSANDSSIPVRESGDDCEKFIEASRIPKGTNSPQRKVSRSLSLSFDKRNDSQSVTNDEDKSKRGNNSADSQNLDLEEDTSVGKSNNARLKRGEDLLSNNVDATKENGTEQGNRPMDRPSVKRKCTIKEKPPGASLLKTASLDDSHSHNIEGVEDTESDSNSSRSKGVSPAQDDLSSPKASPRAHRSQVRVYKPKTRMVNQVNAERAKESASTKQQQDIDRIETSKSKQKESTTTATTTAITSINTVSTTTVITTKPVNSTTVVTTVSKTAAVTTTNLLTSVASNHTLPITTISTTSTGQTMEQPMAFFLLVNNGIQDVGKKSQQIDDSRITNDTLAIIKQEPKEQHHQPQQKKESKARKSFPNKPPPFPQISQAHPSPPKAPASPPDAMVYIPGHRNENVGPYRLPPPEAGPLSAQLHRGGEELATRMTQLIEEALKEAAQGNHNSQNNTSDNHQATIHFLRLQIERMRWQHQQQLVELKHNTDLTMREMRASLEAERQRAVEETKREAEEERVRCIEETKRKQWCALCGNEALFYCCWNTAYCDYPCQEAHWPNHMRTCAQNPPPNAISTTTANNQQQNGAAKTCGPASRVYALQNGAYRVVPTSSPCSSRAPAIKALKIHQP